MEILHLAMHDDWDQAVDEGEYRVSTRGLSLDEVGFIHASTASQLPTIAVANYSGSSERLLLLVMDDEALRSAGIEVRYEDGGDGELYPHIYGAIPAQLVQRTLPAQFDEAGAFGY
jgi:uncharacterized protein (DUF952 family)